MMRFRNLLGLLAIGGAVAYAQKKRGGELSLAGFKKTAREMLDRVRGRYGDVSLAKPSSVKSPVASSTSDLESSARPIDEPSTGYASRSYGGSSGTGRLGADTSNGIGGNRKL